MRTSLIVAAALAFAASGAPVSAKSKHHHRPSKTMSKRTMSTKGSTSTQTTPGPTNPKPGQ